MPEIFLSCTFLQNPVRTILYIFCMMLPVSDLTVCIAFVNIGYVCYTYAHNVCSVSCSIVSLQRTVQSSLTFIVHLTKHSGVIHTLHTCRTRKQELAIKECYHGQPYSVSSCLFCIAETVVPSTVKVTIILVTWEGKSGLASMKCKAQAQL